MDDNILSHKKTAVISYIINKVRKKIGYLSDVRGQNNTFLGMKIDIKGKKNTS